MTRKMYECPDCGNKTEAEEPPECCGNKMQTCTMAPSDPEHARTNEIDEPCDDGRGA